jgi:hypothetical protein
LAGTLLALIAVQMLCGRSRPELPGIIGSVALPSARITRSVERALPVLCQLERFIHPRWSAVFKAGHRAVASALFLMALLLINPVPCTTSSKLYLPLKSAVPKESKAISTDRGSPRL